MKKISFLLFLSCSFLFSQKSEEESISIVLNDWHKAAANADFEGYFGLMTNNAVFIGTDAGENWQRKDFIAYSKPHFDKGKAWSFTAVERNIYVNEAKNLAWFDELLDTQMKICRGSGVLKKEDTQWKIAHYVLSIVVPNEHVAALIELKKQKDSVLLKSLRLK